MEREDAQLIQNILLGDDAAFNTLVQRYQKGVHALAWRKIGDFHYAEEITQDTFLQAYKKLSTLRNPDQFAGWLYVIANRLCIDWNRKQKPATQSLEDTPVKEIEESAYARYISEKQETEVRERRYEIVERLLERLPESERTVVTLHYLGEMTTRQIGKFLGVSVGTIDSRLHRARKRLQAKEELLVQEVLGGVQLSASVSQNIMRQIADMKLTPAPVSKPLLPWVACGAAAVLLVLLIGFSNRYLVRFQKPYSFEAKSKPTIEIIEAPAVLDIDAKPSVRNQIGRADTEGKSSGTSMQMDETVSMSRALEDAHTLPAAQWMPDAALRTAVREALALSEDIPLTKERMQELQHLTASGKGITNIKGLEFAQNLVQLHLGDEGNYVTDLSPLATLTSLAHLNVGGNEVKDLRPLANLTNLTGLSLWYNRVTDVSPLRSLTSLTYLNLADNRISDLTPLANLISLEKLDLFDNEIENVVPLSGLKNLKHLILTYNRVEDFSPLAELTNLQVLWIKKNPIRDLSPLVRLNLTDLKYDGVSLATEQIAPSEIWMPDPALWMEVRGELGLLPGVPLTKEKMQELTYLDAQNRGITYITGLEFATHLRELHIGRNPITDLYPLSNLTMLESLHIWNLSPRTPNLDLRPLANLINLEELSLERNGISDIRLLARLKKLRLLHLTSNQIEDISPLSGLTELRTLWLKENPIKDLSPLIGLNLTDLKYDGLLLMTEQTEPSETWMPDAALWTAVRGELGLLPGVPLTKETLLRLERIEVNNNDTLNLTGLEFATNLKTLTLDGNNHITGLRSIANLINLVELRIWRQEDAPPTNLDILLLANLTNLEELAIEGSGISDISILAGFVKLQRLYLENNHIEDFSPLAGLTNLQELRIRNNRAIDFRPLVPLNLTLFKYDEVYEDLPAGTSRP
ncbi:MAG: sigma-70 family RNA polymerase sigma factor [Candidatus Poribacteria bacterium]|nr:sigma-70 family RNA polymerase sigma factor [Candidatus Poribacteria bacterium]